MCPEFRNSFVVSAAMYPYKVFIVTKPGTTLVWRNIDTIRYFAKVLAFLENLSER